ncbi:MAG: hypothetical protein IT487_19350 [Chromatiaceae bacterium]|nr:hypothetical protein [Chromatiaceae bacterium]
MPRPFHPTSRAEAVAAPLSDVRLAASEDRAYLAGLAQIVADLLAPPAATDTKPATDRARRDWQQAQRAVTREHIING